MKKRGQGRRQRAPTPAVQQTPRAAAIRWRAAVIVLAGILVYWNGLSSPFLFDDRNSILENTRIRELWPLSIPLSPPRDTPVAGRPLVNLSFAINYAIHGLDVVGYRLFNLAVHLLAALVLFGVVRRTLLLPRKTSLNIAWACALVWVLHPLQTEVVDYLSHRTESMMGLFYLVTMYCSVRAVDRGKGEGGSGGGRGKREGGRTKWQMGAVAACAAGMACKESMVTAPVMVVLYDRIFVFDSMKAAFRARRGLYAGLAATWLVLAGLMSSTPRASVGFDAGTSSWVYLLNQFQLIAQYLRLTIWPRALVLDYGLPQPLELRNVLPQAALVLAVGITVLLALARRPPLGFLGAWFFITLAPTSSVVPIATEVGAERRMYLPLAALVVLAVIAWHKMMVRLKADTTYVVSGFLARRSSKSEVGSRTKETGVVFLTEIRKNAIRFLDVAVLTVICVLLAGGTILRNGEYQSRLSIAETIVERWPSGRAHYILGVELLREGRRTEAMSELRASAPDYPAARYALGTELFADGMLDAAIEELRTFVRELPTHPNVIPAHDQLGRAFLMQGRLDEAMEQFTIVLAQPDYRLRQEVLSLVEEIQAARRGRL